MSQTLSKKCRFSIDDKVYHLAIADSIEDVSSDWPVHVKNPFLSPDYLRCVESAPPYNMAFAYAIVFRDDIPQVIYYFQAVHFNAAKSLSPQLSEAKSKRSFSTYFKQKVKHAIARNIDFLTMVNGNLLLTGENGFESLMTCSNEHLEQIHAAVFEKAESYLESVLHRQVSVLLIKENYSQNRLLKLSKKEFGLYEFCIEPNFSFNVPPEWTSLDDYKQSLRAKYRIRANRAEKKKRPIYSQELNADDILRHKERLYDLYLSIADNAGFNMAVIHKDYLHLLKADWGQQFRLIAFMDNDQVIGFYSYFLFEDKLVAHFVGFEKSLVVRHQLYLNMLLELIDTAITHKVSRINLGRTANEIKSSVGAVPTQMYCYIKHKKSTFQKIVPGLIDYLQPQDEWQLRHPFKKQ